FDKEQLHKAAFDEVRRIIREDEPPKPSTRISTLGQASTAISAQRKSDPKSLSQLCRGDLDWIVMKALEKDRTRRYETASAFAADVQRHIKDEPVEARPPSALYKFRKFARRNRQTLATGVVLGMAVLIGVAAVGGSIGWLARDQAGRRAETDQLVSQALEESASWQRLGRLPEA